MIAGLRASTLVLFSTFKRMPPQFHFFFSDWKYAVN